MELNEADLRLIDALTKGLPLVPQPYRELGRRAGLTEAETIAALRRMTSEGLIKRLGVIVRHHELGYWANAMVVWDVPDHRVADIGRRLGAFDFVTLCYQRPRHLPDWPYNLFCMIHGRDRSTVLAQVDRLAQSCRIEDVPRAVLFSTRRFKQRGPLYGDRAKTSEKAA